jgi:hypothetical protein
MLIVPMGWIITLVRIDSATLYQAMNMPPEQVRIMESMNALTPKLMTVPIAAMALAGVGYTIWVRKYFSPGAEAARAG